MGCLHPQDEDHLGESLRVGNPLRGVLVHASRWQWSNQACMLAYMCTSNHKSIMLHDGWVMGACHAVLSSPVASHSKDSCILCIAIHFHLYHEALTR